MSQTAQRELEIIRWREKAWPWCGWDMDPRLMRLRHTSGSGPPSMVGPAERYDSKLASLAVKITRNDATQLFLLIGEIEGGLHWIQGWLSSFFRGE